MGKINFKVIKANREQLDSVISDEKIFNKERKDIYFGFVAVNEDENIIGYLIAYEKNIIVSSIDVKRWWIEYTFVLPEIRKQGIGDALVKALINYASESGITQIESGTTPERIASKMLFLKNDFCFFALGVGRDEKTGYYQHLILRRISIQKNIENQKNHKIEKMEKQQLLLLIDKYFVNDELYSQNQFFNGKRDDMFGFIAVDKDGSITGFILAFEFGLMPPLNGVQWWIPYTFVNSELRRRGIASALLKEIIKSAKDRNVTQLTAISQSDESLKFCLKNNFGIYGQIKYQTEKTNAIGFRIV